MKTTASLTSKLTIADSDYIAALKELDEWKERSQRFLEHLKIQHCTVWTPHRELKTRDIVNEMGWILSLSQQLMVQNDAS